METIIYKLTDKNGMTRGLQWGEGVTHSLPEIAEPRLCAAGLIHAYESPLLAEFMAPTYGYEERECMLWEARTPRVVLSDGTKLGCYEVTTVRKLERAALTTEQRVRFGIACAWAAYEDDSWRKWARDWVSGQDRSQNAAREAARAASAAWELRAADAAWAADAAEAAWEVARAAWAARAATRAAWAAEAAADAAAREVAWAARAAARAADAAAVVESHPPFMDYANWAITSSSHIPELR